MDAVTINNLANANRVVLTAEAGLVVALPAVIAALRNPDLFISPGTNELGWPTAQVTLGDWQFFPYILDLVLNVPARVLVVERASPMVE